MGRPTSSGAAQLILRVDGYGSGRMKTESLKHKESFEYYYTLGDKRSIPKVAQKYSVSVAAVKKWSRAFNWQERVEQRDIENAKRLEKKTDAVIVNEKAKYRAVIKEAFAKFEENLKKGKVAVETVQDAERLVKLDLLIMGESPGDEGELKIRIKVVDDE